MSNGWDESASAWIADMGESGDWARCNVLDAPMLSRAKLSGAQRAVDVGCGEGRFCRMLAAEGMAVTGVDPTAALIARAQQRHPEGDYRLAMAEHLPFEDASFDLVVSYLSLIDIPDAATAISEMARVLVPGGRLLIANLASFSTAGMPDYWFQGPDGSRRRILDNYLGERSDWVAWRNIRIRNWHRPLSLYMQWLLATGLVLRYFDEPPATGGSEWQIAEHSRVPDFLIMEWQRE